MEIITETCFPLFVQAFLLTFSLLQRFIVYLLQSGQKVSIRVVLVPMTEKLKTQESRNGKTRISVIIQSRFAPNSNDLFSLF